MQGRGKRNILKLTGDLIGQTNYDETVKLTVCGNSVYPPVNFNEMYVVLFALAMGADPNVVKVIAAFGVEFAAYAADDHHIYPKGVLIRFVPDVDGSVLVMVDESARKKDQS